MAKRWKVWESFLSSIFLTITFRMQCCCKAMYPMSTCLPWHACPLWFMFGKQRGTGMLPGNCKSSLDIMSIIYPMGRRATVP